MNDALCAIGMTLRSDGPNVQSSDWTLRCSDGTSHVYRDGMLVRATGPRDAARGRAVMDAYAGGASGGGALAAGGPSSQQHYVAGPAQPRATGGMGAATASATMGAARALPQPRVAGMAGAGAPSWAQPLAAAAPVAAVARAHPPGFHQPHQHHPAGAHPHNHAAAAGAAAAGAGGAPPRNPSVAQQLAAAAQQAGLHESDLADDEACVICLAEPRDTVLVPCGHVVLCASCCDDVMSSASKECPICRKEIQEVIEVQE